MKFIKWTILSGIVFLFVSGCSKDVREISDIALVMMSGIDYDKKQGIYTFTAYCILPSTTSMEKSSMQNEWVVSGHGSSIMDAARNLRSRAGKTMIWQHDKFFIIGQEAATYTFYEFIDYLTRSRDIRLSSYIVVSEGLAAEKLKIRSETNDLVANDFLGRTTNQHLWGKSVSLMVKDVSNWYSSTHRGFVTGRLRLERPANSMKEVLVLDGGSVFNKGRFVDWLKGEDTLVVYLLTKKREWSKLEFPITVKFKSAKVTLLLQSPKSKFHFTLTGEDPALDMELTLRASLVDMDSYLQMSHPDILEQLERTADKQVEQMITRSMNLFQKKLKVDVLGFSDYIRQYHPNEWNRMKDKWDELYPVMPVRVQVNTQFSRIGMSQMLEGD